MNTKLWDPSAGYCLKGLRLKAEHLKGESRQLLGVILQMGLRIYSLYLRGQQWTGAKVLLSRPLQRCEGELIWTGVCFSNLKHPDQFSIIRRCTIWQAVVPHVPEIHLWLSFGVKYKRSMHKRAPNVSQIPLESETASSLIFGSEHPIHTHI